MRRDTVQIIPIGACVSTTGVNKYNKNDDSTDALAYGYLASLPSNDKFYKGSYWNDENTLPDKVVFNEKKETTTLLYKMSNGYAATTVKTSKDDKYDKRLGFLIAYFQKHSGLSKTQANKYLDELVENDKIQD